jgi:hypothetical protein
MGIRYGGEECNHHAIQDLKAGHPGRYHFTDLELVEHMLTIQRNVWSFLYKLSYS